MTSQPTTFPELHPQVVLGIGAHPDDLDFSASGTMATFAAQGAEIHYLILTDGSSGSADYNASAEALKKTREDEQQAAVKAIDGKSARFFGYPDGALLVTLALKKDIVKVIRELKPDVVITMDPSVLYSADRGFINHPDHRAAGQATLDAVFPLARDHMSFPELFEAGYEPHKVKTVLLSNMNEHNYIVDISDNFDKKLGALAAHKSQIPVFSGIEQMVKQWAETMGQKAGFHYGESFMRIDVR